MVLTAVWAGAFGFSAAVGFAGDVIYGDTDNFWTGWILQLAALSFAVAFTEFYPEYARAKAVASDEHPLPSWTRVLHWIPPFVLGTGVAGWVFGAVADVACLLLVLLGAQARPSSGIASSDATPSVSCGPTWGSDAGSTAWSSAGTGCRGTWRSRAVWSTVRSISASWPIRRAR